MNVLGERGDREAYRFGGRPYVVGQSYHFRQLPPDVQEDVLAQDEAIEAHYGLPAQDASYRLIIVQHKDLVRSLLERFGETGLRKRLGEGKIKALASKIEREGLQQPPVLDEGIHRALALALLGWDMPYFTIDETMSMPEPTFIPTLDGRSLPSWRRR